MNMKHAVMGAVAGMMVMAAGAGLANPPFGIGKPAPDFTAVDIDGKTQSLRQYRGKIVVLDWANPACPIDDGKHYQSGNIPSMQKQAAAQGIVWLTINSSAKGMPGAGDEYVGERLKAWQESVHWSAASYIQDRSGAIGRSYHASTTPQMYLIDKDGLLRYAGAIDSVPSSDPADIPKATNYLKQALGELEAGKPVSVAVTQPYGCTVKYGH